MKQLLIAALIATVAFATSEIKATAGGTFTQSVCKDATCTSCESETIPQNTCVLLESGGSIFATCTKQEVDIRVYSNSTTCSGEYSIDVMPTDQCLVVIPGEYVKNTCSASASVAEVKAARGVRSLRK